MEERFGDLLRDFRERAGLTQEALADESRKGRTTISEYERGDSVPSRTALEDIVTVLEHRLPSLDKKKLFEAAANERAIRRQRRRGVQDAQPPEDDTQDAGEVILPSPKAPKTGYFKLLPRHIGRMFILLGVLFLGSALIRLLTPCRTWNLASDTLHFSYGRSLFLIGDAYGINPFSDTCRNSDVWYFLKRDVSGVKPGPYLLLTEYIDDAWHTKGLMQWQNNKATDNDYLPVIGVNTTGTLQTPANIRWPSNAVLVHPHISRDAVVGWHSPIDGAIRIDGSLQDLQVTCGDGISWSIYLNSLEITHGEIDNGGEKDLMDGTMYNGYKDLRNIQVNRGDYIYFIINAMGSNKSRIDYDCDSTSVDISITNTQKP